MSEEKKQILAHKNVSKIINMYEKVCKCTKKFTERNILGVNWVKVQFIYRTVMVY